VVDLSFELHKQHCTKELPREGQAKKFWSPVPEEKKRPGVQYPESPVRELAKKYGVRLSEAPQLPTWLCFSGFFCVPNGQSTGNL
jgi:hypothetical protein